MEDFFLPISFTSKFRLLSGITTRRAGNLKIRTRRKEIARLLNISYCRITTGEQVHKNNIAIVRTKDLGTEFPDTDGLITDLVGVPLAIFVADCPPIFLFEPERRIIGLLHAGWRSTLGNISYKAVDIISREFRAKPENLLVTIGPHICKECYKVGWSPVAEAFTHCFEPFGKEVLNSIILESGQTADQSVQEKSWCIDLARANSCQFEKAGVRSKNIGIPARCTYEDENFFSYRRDNGSPSRMMALIQLNR